MDDKLRALVLESMLETVPTLADSRTDPETWILFGDGAVMDSLGLVRTLATLEDLVLETFGRPITIANEAALSRSRSPFKTFVTLTAYVAELLAEAQGRVA